MVLAYSVINKCIGDDTKAAAHQTQSALKKKQKKLEISMHQFRGAMQYRQAP